MGHDQHHDHDHRHGGHRRVLDLDALVFAPQLSAVLDALGPLAPRRVVDLGAGTGAGSRLLRERFPDADLLAVDRDPRMLDHLRHQGFATREADLDAGFPDVGDVDLVWAASSLHHVADPARLLTGIRAALAPGGTLAVVELEGLPAFTDAPAETRGREAALAAGWNHHPDWTPALRAAGFAVQRQDLTIEADASAQAEEYARLWLPRYAQMPGADPDALAALLAGELDLRPRATRAVWTAR
ncbi:class I SAM-dependent methyltransferase [Kineococcus rhizosphaerae]|nr:methyltransferase domain-containing protein [Kineococcus rhizosphaerae]